MVKMRHEEIRACMTLQQSEAEAGGSVDQREAVGGSVDQREAVGVAVPGSDAVGVSAAQETLAQGKRLFIKGDYEAAAGVLELVLKTLYAALLTRLCMF